ncbi:hypothetical protein PSHT_02936 [Puccinia striiformis]|uniref:Nascent polypeptide-associated complex subunit beta n=3 Tax=Puccinia striiformis TaxID=27350 RepID=A0A2S4WH47_9BASI|nr:hypothetical protein PSHT_02936 [Puccinia striiformis]
MDSILYELFSASEKTSSSLRMPNFILFLYAATVVSPQAASWEILRTGLKELKGAGMILKVKESEDVPRGSSLQTCWILEPRTLEALRTIKTLMTQAMSALGRKDDVIEAACRYFTEACGLAPRASAKRVSAMSYFATNRKIKSEYDDSEASFRRGQRQSRIGNPFVTTDRRGARGSYNTKEKKCNRFQIDFATSKKRSASTASGGNAPKRFRSSSSSSSEDSSTDEELVQRSLFTTGLSQGSSRDHSFPPKQQRLPRNSSRPSPIITQRIPNHSDHVAESSPLTSLLSGQGLLPLRRRNLSLTGTLAMNDIPSHSGESSPLTSLASVDQVFINNSSCPGLSRESSLLSSPIFAEEVVSHASTSKFLETSQSSISIPATDSLNLGETMTTNDHQCPVEQHELNINDGSQIYDTFNLLTNDPIVASASTANGIPQERVASQTQNSTNATGSSQYVEAVDFHRSEAFDTPQGSQDPLSSGARGVDVPTVVPGDGSSEPVEIISIPDSEFSAAENDEDIIMEEQEHLPASLNYDDFSGVLGKLIDTQKPSTIVSSYLNGRVPQSLPVRTLHRLERAMNEDHERISQLEEEKRRLHLSNIELENELNAIDFADKRKAGEEILEKMAFLKSQWSRPTGASCFHQFELMLIFFLTSSDVTTSILSCREVVKILVERSSSIIETKNKYSVVCRDRRISLNDQNGTQNTIDKAKLPAGSCLSLFKDHVDSMLAIAHVIGEKMIIYENLQSDSNNKDEEISSQEQEISGKWELIKEQIQILQNDVRLTSETYAPWRWSSLELQGSHDQITKGWGEAVEAIDAISPLSPNFLQRASEFDPRRVLSGGPIERDEGETSNRHPLNPSILTITQGLKKSLEESNIENQKLASEKIDRRKPRVGKKEESNSRNPFIMGVSLNSKRTPASPFSLHALPRRNISVRPSGTQSAGIHAFILLDSFTGGLIYHLLNNICKGDPETEIDAILVVAFPISLRAIGKRTVFNLEKLCCCQASWRLESPRPHLQIAVTVRSRLMFWVGLGLSSAADSPIGSELGRLPLTMADAGSFTAVSVRLFKMNNEKLKQLQAQTKVGTKGQPRRKEIKRPKGFTANGGPAGDDKKLQAALKKLNVQPMIGMEEVNMFKDEGSKILHFSNPKVHGAANVNTFAIHGNGVEKDLTELVPGILPQLGAESIANLRRLASSLGDLHQANSMSYKPPNMAVGANNDDDDVPALVDSFDVDEGAAPAETTAFESVD